MSKRDRPVLPVKIADSRLRQTDAAVYVDTILEDANGVRWVHHSSGFYFDIEKESTQATPQTSAQKQH
jgi:hypothetical protein